MSAAASSGAPPASMPDAGAAITGSAFELPDAPAPPAAPTSPAP
eukprot:CAMPEP_0181352882 /NCGR_PEP_ID=MMETSP1106-20121128/2545_1 /TAXON_ID=81844 /ORGANISM="Mantoniella antarctica, Strain SL-175" /LENGTH=43 /DNA_ID= /DNA_START= /DNA_END= /DNA_ORIENTATION=